MKFLYLGVNAERCARLKKALNRSHIELEQAETPEYAYFKVLHREISAIFLDLSEPSFDGSELIANCESTGEKVEIVLICDPDVLAGYDREVLRSCYGFITPQVEAPVNAMVLHQVTEKVLAGQRMARLKNSSIIDGLTQLHNHAYFQQQLSNDIQHRRKIKEVLSLAIFDIDHFKHYNDRNGHPEGDLVLKKVAEMVNDTVRKIDFSARYGGEEFVIVLPGVPMKSALRVCERLRKKICGGKFTHGHAQPLGFVSASFGVATLDHVHLTKKNELIRFADQALYKAKGHRRNCIWFYDWSDYFYYDADHGKPDLNVKCQGVGRS